MRVNRALKACVSICALSFLIAIAVTTAFSSESKAASGTNSFSGVLTDGNGNPISGFKITLGNNDGNAASATTGTDGSYTINAVPDTYNIMLANNGHSINNITTLRLQQNSNSVNLSNGNINQNLQLQTTTLQVKVVDSNGKPITTVPVTANATVDNGTTHLYSGDGGVSFLSGDNSSNAVNTNSAV
jgi:hypothetical protein